MKLNQIKLINQYYFSACEYHNYATSIARLILIFCILLFSQLAVADDALQLLKQNNISKLDTLLVEVQHRFEKDELSEIELRNTFRPFYELDEVSAQNLINWASSSPKSYVAHLALGIYFKHIGVNERGAAYMVNIPQSNIDKMTLHYRMSAEELRKSLELTQKPYLSIFHLLTISMQFGDEETSLEMLNKANELLPNNSLVRNRYAISLTPRWGGSYNQLDKFISHTKVEPVPSSVVFQLEAIKHDDLGNTLEEQNQHATAMEHFRAALQLANQVGGTFAKDFLQESLNFVCSGENNSPLCP